MRDFMNEGGRLLYTGKFAGRQYTLAEYPIPGRDARASATACPATRTGTSRART